MDVSRTPLLNGSTHNAEQQASIICAIYGRVSTNRQAQENTSIAVQLEECRKYAAARGMTVFKEYVDAGASGTTDKGRPAFGEMIAEALEPDPAFQLILVYDHSRFYRNVGESEVI